MSRSLIIKQMRLGFKREFKEIKVNANYVRDIPQDNAPSQSTPYFDPVTETWVNLPVGDTTNPDKIEYETNEVLVRKLKTSVMDRFSLTNTDRKFTYLYDDFIQGVGSTPQVNDRVVVDEGDFRVAGWTTDPYKVFISVFAKRNP